MRTVHRYIIDATALHSGAVFSLSLPAGAEILSIQTKESHGDPSVWALVNPDAPVEARQIHIYGTGHLMPDEPMLRFIGTFRTEYGRLVFHAFEPLVEVNR
jgi:hypothetical protein